MARQNHNKIVALNVGSISSKVMIKIKNHPVYATMQLARLNVVIQEYVWQLHHSDSPYATFTSIPDKYKYNPAIMAVAIDKLAPRSLHLISSSVPDQSFISEKDFFYMIDRCAKSSMYLLANAISDNSYTSAIAKQLVLSSGNRISEVYEKIPERLRDSDLAKMALRTCNKQKDREFIYTLTPPNQRDESLNECYFSYLNR